MKRWMMMLSGIIIVLGVSACKPNEFPAAPTAGFVNPEITATTVEITSSPEPTNSPIPPETALPTATVSPLPTHTLTPTVETCQPGQIETRALDSEILEASLEYLVYLPPCYDLQTDRKYPVVYLFHGQTYSNTHWIDLGAAEIADRLITAGEIAPFIMVFPYDRRHYDPPTVNPFGQAVLVELIPTIELTYRVIPERGSRALGGISRGGNWAAHLGLQYPEIFSAIGLHSTPIFSSDTNPEIRDWLAAIPSEILPRLYIDTGKNDRWRQYTLTFAELIDQASIPHEWHLYPGFHEDAYWEAHLEQYIRWYVAPWSEEGGT